MTDRDLDSSIRALVVQLAESSPAAPAAADLGLAGDGLAPYTRATEAPRRRRPGRLKLLGAAIAATAVAGGGGFAIASLTVDDGTAEPEAAVENFVEALADEDAIGVLESLAPDEREVLVPFLSDAIPELERIGLLEGVELSAVDGFDFEVEGLELTSRRIAPGIAAVRIVGGRLTSAVTANEIPIGDAVRSLVDDDGDDLSRVLGEFADRVDEGAGTLVGDLDREDFELVVVDDDGWHLSLNYTIAEAARKAAGLPPPDFGAPIIPVGADSPEEAVVGFLQALSASEWDRAIALADPAELPALYDYGHLFLDQIDAEATLAASFEPGDVSAEGSGGQRLVTIGSFTREYGEGLSMTWDGRCVTITNDAGPERTCVDDPGLQEFERTWVDQTVRMVASERDGRWYVSPLRTVTRQALAGLREAPVIEDGDDGLGVGSLGRFELGPFLGPLFLARTITTTSSSSGSFAEQGVEMAPATTAVPSSAVPTVPDTRPPTTLVGD